MIVLVGGILGVVTGALVARRRKGNWADMAQFGFVYGVLFALAAVFLTILIHRLTG
ncbi:MAG: hypothetical protein M5U35_09580 [Roseovarius sp.]|nr:hypothetical protein [Roseovarius sp.]